MGKKEVKRKMRCDGVEKEEMNTVLTANLVDSTTSGVLAEEVAEIGEVGKKLQRRFSWEPIQHVTQSWDCLQVETELEVRDAMFPGDE